MAQEPPDKPNPSHRKPIEGKSSSENPYTSPLEAHVELPPVETLQRSSSSGALMIIGYVLLGLLLFIVVAFGLLLGCCAVLEGI